MNPSIDIYDITGVKLLSAIVSESAVSHEELMLSDYVQLEWNSDAGDVLPTGSYITYGGERYSLLEPYTPERLDEAEYRYAPQFQSRIMAWQKKPVPIYTYGSDGVTVEGREFDWEFTGSPADAMYMVQQAIKNETGETWNIEIADSLPATITVSSQSESIFSLLSAIADACETEWWADKGSNTIYLSFCQHGAAVSLATGVNIYAPNVTESKDGYYTRFYAFGSTRNITQDYDGGQAANSIVNKRLTLDPAKYPGGYKDVKGHFDGGVFVSDLKQGEVFPKILYFDSVYPKSKLQIAGVRARLKYRLDNSTGDKVQTGVDAEGNPVYEQYAIWYFKVANFIFDPDTIIEGKNLSAHFESGQLAGRDFELHYYEDGKDVNDGADVSAFRIEAGDYEIILDETSGTTIPGLAYIIPQNGDDIVLYNIKMPQEYVDGAQEDLETELDKEITRRNGDNNSYEFDSYPTVFDADGIDLSLGRSVSYNNGGDTLQTRVLMVEKHLDYPCQQRIRVGNERIKGTTQQLKEEVTNANENIDLLKAFNDLSQSVTNAYANAQREMIEGFAAIKNIWRFDPDNPDTIYSEYNAYVKGSLSALGLSEGGEGGGSVDILQDWAQYDAGTAKSTALSAYLGYELYQKLQSGAVLSLKSEGTGNVVTGISKNGTVLTVTKGSIDLSPYATKGELDDRIDELVNGAPAAFDTLKEIADVLQGNVDSIGDIITTLGTKADKAVKITAGAGLTGGGDLSANRTLALAAVGTAGTYTKVTTDAYGRVTAGTTLSAADIPTLAISKISGLQAALDSKLNAADFAQYFAEQMAQWFVRDTGNKALRPADYGGEAYGLYSNAFVSALGVSQGGASGGGGGAADILQDWAEYTDDKATWALSAKLGYELYEDVTSLKNGSALNFTTTGSGNVVSAITKSGTTVTVNKGITALTSHQSIYALTIQGNGTTIGTFNPKSAAATINITPGNIGAPTKTGSGASGTWGISISGNASTATKLQTARQINGTNFDGSANITTAKWGTARSIYIRDASQAHTGTAVSVDGSSNEYLLLPSTIAAALEGNATSATKLQTARTLWGQSFNGTANVSGDMSSVGNISLSGRLYWKDGIYGDQFAIDTDFVSTYDHNKLRILSAVGDANTANNMFHFSHGLYSDGAVSALGVGSASGGGGGGSVDILQDWAQYDAGTAKSTALSAYLGYEMRQELQSTVGNIGNTPDYVCTLDLSDIDLDFGRIQQAIVGTRPMFYIVTDNTVGNYVVGTMCMFSDNMHHVLTQVLTTHFLVQDGVFSSHVDSKVYTYYRSYNFGAPGLEGPTRQWTEWREAYGLTGEGSFMGVATPSTAAPSLAYGEEAYYVAATAGTYANLGGLTVASGEVALIRAAYSPGGPSTSFSKTTLSKAGGAVTIASITDLHSSWDSVLKAQKPSWLTSVSIATISDLNSGWDALLKAAPASATTSKMGFMSASDKDVVNRLTTLLHDHAIMYSSPELTGYWGNASYGEIYIPVFGYYDGAWNESTTTIRLPRVSTSNIGLMTADDKKRLDALIDAITGTGKGFVNGLLSIDKTATSISLNYELFRYTGDDFGSSDFGTVLPSATTSLAGLMSAADKTKLNSALTSVSLSTISDLNSGWDALLKAAPAAATASTMGFMSASDKAKMTEFSNALYNLETMGLLKNDGNGYLERLSSVTQSTNSITINFVAQHLTSAGVPQSGYSIVTLPAASTTKAGLMSASDKTTIGYLYGGGGGVSWSSISGWFINNTSATVNAQKITKVDSYFDLYAIRIEDTEHQVYHITDGTDAGPLIAVCGSYQTTRGDYIAMFTVVLPNTARRPYATRYVINYA